MFGDSNSQAPPKPGAPTIPEGEVSMFQHFTGLLISALAVHLGTSKEVKNYKEKNQGTGSAIKRFYISNSTVTKKQKQNKKNPMSALLICQPRPVLSWDQAQMVITSGVGGGGR